MSNNILVEKTVFDKNFSKVIDTTFRELGNINQPTLSEDISIDQFFDLYENIFYNIPQEGDINSHRYILNKTADYLGVSIGEEINIQSLLDEITSLRQELLDIKKLNINS